MASWMSEWQSSTPKEMQVFQERYAAVVREKGELYEDGVVPLAAEDFEFLLRKRKVFKTIWLAAFSAVGLFTISTLIFKDYFGSSAFPNLMFLVIAIGGAGIMFLVHLNKPLKFKVKRVIKGVITEKRMVDQKGCFLQISLKELVQVWPADYKRLSLGDVVVIDILSDDIYVKRRVTQVGKV